MRTLLTPFHVAALSCLTLSLGLNGCSAGGTDAMPGPTQQVPATVNPTGSNGSTAGNGSGNTDPLSPAEPGSTTGGNPASGGDPSAGGGSVPPAGGGTPSAGGATPTGSSGSTAGGIVTEGDIIVVGDDNAIPPGCGDGELTPDEACDDGNKLSGDGCDEDCLQVEPGFSCAAPGEACREIARCGDGIVAMTEQCDDGNVTAGDGCSDRCRVELGKKCEGEPSTCTDAKCGNGIVEGAESCDDGNTEPFDGCSALCLREPNCEGTSCTSECGDGLIINEDCDDGNTTSGDGCSADCKKEAGFTCSQMSTCEQVNGACVLRVPAIYRDFSDSQPDFGWPESECGIVEGDPIVPGIAQDTLDAEGRPVLGKAPALACIASADSFSKWFRDSSDNVRVVGDLVLFENGDGGYVNRWGANGEQFIVTVKGPNEQQVNNATSAATCTPGCSERTRSGLQCDNVCRPDNDAVDQATRQLQQLENAQTPDEVAIADLTAEIEALTVTADACNVDCQTRFDALVEACVADCKPCSYSPAQYCTGGQYVYYDGSPLFFPVDSVTGKTSDLGTAKIPLQYGYDGWPDEDEVFPGAKKHNFYFTSEVQYWFRYEADTNATLEFTGDDDVFVFVNGKLAVDLGGIHVPMDGAVTINATTATKFGLQPGNVYKIVVFQAERKMYGSSFRLTLSGFEATPSDCSAVCGDGILSFGEECDDGINDGGYGECDVGCKLGPFCGDGIVQGEEDCDNGPGGGAGCAGCRILVVR